MKSRWSALFKRRRETFTILSLIQNPPLYSQLLFPSAFIVRSIYSGYRRSCGVNMYPHHRIRLSNSSITCIASTLQIYINQKIQGQKNRFGCIEKYCINTFSDSYLCEIEGQMFLTLRSEQIQQVDHSELSRNNLLLIHAKFVASSFSLFYKQTPRNRLSIISSFLWFCMFY